MVVVTWCIVSELKNGIAVDAYSVINLHVRHADVLKCAFVGSREN